MYCQIYQLTVIAVAPNGNAEEERPDSYLGAEATSAAAAAAAATTTGLHTSLWVFQSPF